ncbi:DUF4238 domain-containing protein [Methylophaga nitratireducenticrescens]|uniref:DUF4238 domain-containing protein n=1 Tax=Methylophaga nitratireducenticrescens TaxID=754476 RepID=UPI000CDCAE7A|nr:DUF4238 domain-containing protein [Methylophaga nitratireducenticrescens]AUZ84772.1 hypothetical protein CDW43_09375 [Methylophaga nitratireducenticrescens]
MTQTRNNHFVPQWYQKGFLVEPENKLHHLKRRKIYLKDQSTKIVFSKNFFTPAQCFYEKDIYSTFFGKVVNDDIEKRLFGQIDDKGFDAVKAFLSDDPAKWHHHFQDFFIFLDAQKIRTPKGLDWVKYKYSELNQIQLMTEMQALRTIHCTVWAESVRELVSANESDIKFILSDHPVTIYNYACPPDSELCDYPNDPDITLKGSQTIFPLDKNRCLILTNLEYAQDPDGVNPIEQRTNAIKIRQSMVMTNNFINERKLTAEEVTKINYIIKTTAKDSIAGGNEGWLYPETMLNCNWTELRHVLMPPANELYQFGGEMYVSYEDGTTYYQDAFGRSTPQSKFLIKKTEESKLGRNDLCGCGSYKKYKHCCKDLPLNLRTSWNELSIRERNLAFCRAIRGILGLDAGKTWLDVRREITEEQIVRVYSFYSALWPRETNIYSLLPKSDGKLRALYTGILDVRVIGLHALPMASLFDEFLIQSPIVNPNNIKSEFNPTQVPSKYKYQALKDFLLMLELEPFIGKGLINLIPDPNHFDLNLRNAMMTMATSRHAKVESERDKEVSTKLTIEDYLNSIHMSPRDVKIQSLVSEFGMPEALAAKSIDMLEAGAETSSLTMLQPMQPGVLIQFSIVPNYEMALFIAQVTGSVIVTDSESRWIELQTGKYRQLAEVAYPLHKVYGQVRRMPMDYQMLDSLTKSQHHFTTARSVLKYADELVLKENYESKQLGKVIDLVSRLNSQLGQVDSDKTDGFMNVDCKILAPQGGFYDSKVQRLLALSSCLRYDHKVRSAYFINLNL